MQSADFARASKIIIWNRWIIGFLGLWPTKVNQPLFVFSTAYIIVYCIMAANHLIRNFSYLERVIANLTDNILFAMILGKMFICKRSCKIMAKFIKSIEIDFSTEMYNNIQEKMAYLYYNKIALIFIKLSVNLNCIASIIYFFKKFLGNWDATISGNFSYELPYPVHPFFEIEDTSTYICVCFYLAIAIPIIVCGYAGADSYVISMTLHICGQFATLSCKVNNLLKDHENYHRHMSNIILRHRHLIRLTEILENNFNIICLQQTLGTVFLLCLTVYHMISTSEYGENVSLVAFGLYVFAVISTIFGYCFTGECLITESAGLNEAFYNSDWYNNPPSYTKLISICMIRIEKPLMLTAGNFYMLSLNMFTSIVKTSMAYLSVLRHFT